MPIAYDVVTVTVTGMMAGNELAVAAFVHPQLRRLSDLAHAHAAASIARSLGKAMPLWYALALILISGAAYEHRPISNGPGLLILSAALLWAVTIVFSIAMLVPINNRIAKMKPDQPYNGWLQDRALWDRLHQIRVVLLTTALLLLLTGLFQAR
jgi:hypothetical protein